MRARPVPSRRHGFTLVEMLMVLLVLAIAAGVALPMLGDTDESRLREAARLLEADLAYAQMESITHGDSPRQVAFDLAAQWYEVRDAAGVAITDPVRKRPYRVAFGEARAAELTGVTIASVKIGAANATALPFGVYGQLAPSVAMPQANAAADASILLSCGGQILQLTIESVTGDVTIGQIQ